MPVLKYYDGSDWEPVVSALQGPTGPTGADSTVPGPTGVGVPTGGVTGEVLSKISIIDYDTEWIDASLNFAPKYFIGVDVTADYTLQLSDVAKVIEVNSSSAVTVTVPDNASVAFPIGTVINVYRSGTGTVTIAAASGVTVRNVGTIPSQFGERSLRKRDTDEWVLI
jgi:hypothetical protein